MLIQETISKLRNMRLTGMLQSLEEQIDSQKFNDLDFFERLSLMVDREETLRNDRRFKTRVKQAKFKESNARMEDVKFKARRN